MITARPTVEAVGRAWALSLTWTIWLAVVAWSMQDSDACPARGAACASGVVSQPMPLTALSMQSAAFRTI